jgi:hypothetical protein
MSYYLFLDDVRLPHNVADYIRPVELRSAYRLRRWRTARNYEKFVETIEKHGLPRVVSFDHDLAPEHYYSPGPEGFHEKTGLSCAKWLCDYCMKTGESLPTCIVHSQNPVGRENIESYLFSFQKHRHNEQNS